MLHIEPIPFLRDNYAWTIHDGTDAIVVDPGEASPILAWLEQRRIRLAAILVTHHHGDHAGGIADLARRHAPRVIGPAGGQIAGITQSVEDGETLSFSRPDCHFQVIALPGHTLDHLGYLGQGHLFCGDTLFSCGCGRLFEGTPAMMQRSLARLAALPDETLICCAHEYTLANLAFARSLEPENIELAEWETEVRRLRALGKPSLPVSLGDEKRRNPFLRWDDGRIRKIVETHLTHSNPEAHEIFSVVRNLKDVFKQ